MRYKFLFLGLLSLAMFAEEASAQHSITQFHTGFGGRVTVVTQNPNNFLFVPGGVNTTINRNGYQNGFVGAPAPCQQGQQAPLVNQPVLIQQPVNQPVLIQQHFGLLNRRLGVFVGNRGVTHIHGGFGGGFGHFHH